jgi:hypothetical protein
MEDTLAEGFKGHRQLPYAHWICFIIRSACELAPGPGQRQRLEVLETAAEQDETIEGLAEVELADLDA